MPLHSQADESGMDAELDINPLYVREEEDPVPRNRIPQHGLLPDTALQVVRDELILDGNARLNLATFVTTWMEPQAQQLMAECFDKNMIDKDEYPQTAELERRCVNILAGLWHARQAARPPAARRPARARRACSAGWRCCGAGAPAGPRPASRPARPTW
jgi:glutamate decarboxylase